MARLLVFFYSYPLAKDNHVGMKHLMNHLKSDVFQVKLFDGVPKSPKRRLIHKVKKKSDYQFFEEEILELLRPDDIIFFAEFLSKGSAFYQMQLMNAIVKKGYRNKILSLLHLPFRYYLENFSPAYLDLAFNKSTRILVFGSSLQRDINLWGFGGKVENTFHFVDTDFFKLKKEKDFTGELKVVVFGNTLRDFLFLRKIIQECPEIQFVICSGNKDLEGFSILPNAQLHGYMEESELVKILEDAHVSLSLMYDVIGSNVLVISKACGLVNIVTDVGSVHDYCNHSNSIICRHEPKEYINALAMLNNNREILKKLSTASLDDGKNYSLPEFVNWFDRFVQQEFLKN